MKATAFFYAERAMQWVDPQWWIWVSFCIFMLCMIHLLPLQLKPENHDFSDRIFLFLRLVFIGSLVLLLVFPVLFYLAFGMLTAGDRQAEASRVVLAWYREMAGDYWGLPLAAWILGVTINFCWHRYASPYFSQVRRKFRVKQAEDEKSDIRQAQDQYQTRRYEPEPYFKDGEYFVALDVNDKPIYIKDDIFESTHSASFAPTGFGKGVEHGVILTQAVRRGNTTFWIDPKGDKRAPYILQQEAARAGRPFIYLDLNPDGKGNWHPFKGGALRDRRSRMLAAYRLTPTGTNADVYKTKERSFVDILLKDTDGSIPAMYEAVKGLVNKDDLSELREGLGEWAQISTFTPNRKRKGHSIEQCLLNNAVVYVRGSLTDNVVKAATRAYVSELIQEANRLYSQRTSHITAFIDETRFLISTEIVDALATTRELRMNMLLATQAISDLRNLEDKTIDGEALQKSVEVNCQIKMIYRAGDAKTAEWGEELAGTKNIRVAGMERTQVNRWGAEEWDNVRSFNKEEVPLFHRNIFLALPHMVFVLYQPTALPTVGFSSWVNVDQSVCSWGKKEVEDPPEASDPPASEAHAGAQPVAAGESTKPSVPDAPAKAATPAPKPAPAALKPASAPTKASGAGQAAPIKKARGNPKLAAAAAAAVSSAPVPEPEQVKPDAQASSPATGPEVVPAADVPTVEAAMMTALAPAGMENTPTTSAQDTASTPGDDVRNIN